MANSAENVKVIQRGGHLGAEIQGINLTQPVDDLTFKVIKDAFVEHELIVFQDQPITSEQQIGFAKKFGELSVHPFSPNSDETPELIIFDNDADNPPFGTDCWHSDETFRAEPPKATMLHGLIIPEVGGDTMFASMTSAYEGLSDRMKNFISGLECIHDFKPFRALFNNDEKGKADLRYFEDRYPAITHPVVRKHPVSGKPVLFVNPQFSIRIKGMSEVESRNLLDQLFEQAKIPEFQYRHCWDVDTVVIWDNRSTQHYAVHDYFPQRRKLNRVTIKGGKVLP
ncbi:MAG: TauD/TfdA family dioxygenase, partial [Rhodospirillales bacterium]|nr:TauD/TfdA family dioxygenase [Rhodospirillales bacterium]